MRRRRHRSADPPVTVIERIDARTTDPSDVADAVARVVLAGGLVIFPTDTVYGIGCDPHHPEAVERIYAAKGRPAFKALSLHIATVAEALEYCGRSRTAAKAVRRLLPGPLTLIVPRPRFIDRRITAGGDTLGLRVPDFAPCTSLLDRVGPLAATSANRSGAPAYRGVGPSADLPDADLFIDAGATPEGGESTIVDLSGEQPRLVREGVVPVARLEAILGPIEPAWISHGGNGS